MDPPRPDTANKLLGMEDCRAGTLGRSSLRLLPAHTARLYSVCPQLKTGAKFSDCAGLPDSQFGLWYRGSKPQPLELDVPIDKTGAPLDANLELCLVIAGVNLLATATATATSETLAGTPIPVAITVGRCRAPSNIAPLLRPCISTLWVLHSLALQAAKSWSLFGLLKGVCISGNSDAVREVKGEDAFGESDVCRAVCLSEKSSAKDQALFTLCCIQE